MQFEPQLIKSKFLTLGCQHWCATTYHSVITSVVVLSQRQLKSPFVASSNSNVVQAFTALLLGLHSTFNPDTPALYTDFVYYRTFRLPKTTSQ